MGVIEYRELRGMGADSEDKEETPPLPPPRKSFLHAFLSPRSRASRIMGRGKPPKVDLPPLPPKADLPPLPPPPSRINNNDLWKLVAVGAISGLLVALLKGRK